MESNRITSQSCAKRNCTSHLKLRSYGLSFHEFRQRFLLFPVVGTGRIDVALGLVIASVVSCVMAVNSAHVKGGGGGQCIQFTRELPRYLPSHAP
ncbi:hypothetical protein AVEN_13121-1 [Araneus ventricosus]|uniref:Uncharacterized protein n=1 Tax=Araneus ventricosus TaxID=182803 RepID=A0A4Y2NL70_ARAVE|nr:hypothetical protein AVEN_13121-1 [Araneus ventricosus]